MVINIKLYVLRTNNNDIFAISEYKYHIRLFILQNEYSNKDYYLEVLDNKKKINKILIKYEHLYLMEYKDFIIRNVDYRYIKEIYNNMKDKVYKTIDNLYDINDSYIMSPKEHELISKCLNLLEKKSKKKNIDEFTNIQEVIRYYYNNTYYQDSIENYNNYEYNLFRED